MSQPLWQLSERFRLAKSLVNGRLLSARAKGTLSVAYWGQVLRLRLLGVNLERASVK